jgi:hypothetical protein
MVGRVARRRDRLQRESRAQLNLVSRRDWMVADRKTRTLRRKERRAAPSEFRAARDVVSMRMRVGSERNLKAARTRGGSVIDGEARRIDHERTAVTQIDEIRRMAQALVNEGKDLDHDHIIVIRRAAFVKSSLEHLTSADVGRRIGDR